MEYRHRLIFKFINKYSIVFKINSQNIIFNINFEIILYIIIIYLKKLKKNEN